MRENFRKNARDTALEVLLSVAGANAWSDGSLKRTIAKNGLDNRDAALASRIAYGVIQNRAYLDHYITLWCSQPAHKLEPLIANILRIGAYQILFMDKIPHRAAVNEAVEMTKRHGRPKASGMVNAVLRKFVTNWLDLPPLPAGSAAQTLSIRYSHPEWLVKRLVEILGAEEAEAYLASNNAIVPTTVQTNTMKTTPDALSGMLKAVGAEVVPHPWMEGCFEVSGTGDLERMDAFRDGYFTVQDAAARLVSTVAQCGEQDNVLDVCSAPGGKSFAVAIDRKDAGKIISCDVHPHKLKLIEKGAERLGLRSITPALADGREEHTAWVGQADVVIADVPCSGLGIIRKKPDIRYKKAEELQNLPAIQKAILNNVCNYVRDGGTLVYSTCTVLPEENEQVVEWFVKNHPEFSLSPFELPQPLGKCNGQLTLWPHRHGTDGFFICRMVKKVVQRESNP